MVCYALPEDVSAATALENFRYCSVGCTCLNLSTTGTASGDFGCRHSKLQLLPTEASYTYKLEVVFRAKPANIDDLLIGLSVIINRFVSNHAFKTVTIEPNQN